ncbi:MAG: glycosyltransferase family 9 protein [Gemmatimonadota bacterium]
MLRPLDREPHRILIVRLGAIGDVARVLPMLNGLGRRFPGAEIDWVVQAKAADLLVDHPQIAQLWVVPSVRWGQTFAPEARALRRRMRDRDYDLVLDFQGMIKGALWALAAGGRAVRVGWGPGHTLNMTWLWYHGLRYPPGKTVNRHLRHRALVDWLDVPDLPGLPPALERVDTGEVDRFLDGSDASRPWILAYPGSSGKGSHKRWDPARFRTALTEIRDRTGGTVLVGWGPAEERDARELAKALDAPAIPPISIRQLAYLLARCDLFVGMDTGPMHLAGLVGTPVVAIFGRSDPRIHGPAAHLPGVAVAGSEARHWPTRKRSDLEPFLEPDPRPVVEAALDVLERHSRDR